MMTRLNDCDAKPGWAGRLGICALATLGVTSIVPQVVAQEVARDSIAGEKTAAKSKKGETPVGYNLHAGPVSFSVQASLRTEFNDNVYYTEAQRKQDIIIRPEVKIGSFWPITDLNSLSLNLGIGYARYLQTDALNSSTPLISPDSELLFNLYVSDFRFQFHERFSYQETVYIDASQYRNAQFNNLSGVGKFGRFENRAGITMDWDVYDLLVSVRYDHETVAVTTDPLKYLDRQSELFSASATYRISEKIKPGIETDASINDYRYTRLHDQWRASAGPFLDVGLSPNTKFRTGAGFATIQDVSQGPVLGSDNTYYAYARINNTLNQYLVHSLDVGHINQLGYNAVNNALTYGRYEAIMYLVRNVDVNLHFMIGFGDEYGGTFKEEYTLYQPGLVVGYRFAQRWRATLSYDFLRKDSDLQYYSYYQNRLLLGVSYKL